MRIAIMGAGAVGCYYGAMLAQAGHETLVIGRPAHVDAIRARHGLVVEKRGGETLVPMQASTDPASVRHAELVLFCVKSGDTHSAGAAMAPHLASNAVILSLQNGVDNAERLQALLHRPVIPAVVYVATEMAGPGHVRHHGRGDLVLGAAPPSAGLARMLADAGIPTEVSDNVAGALWAKLIVNCAYNALSAIAQLPYGKLIEAPGVVPAIRSIVAECIAVAKANRIALPGDIEHAVAQIPLAMSGQYSSTAQDVARGKPSEIDYLNGMIVRKGAECGVPAPVNAMLQTLVKLIEIRAAPARGLPYAK